jgi:hypothetical protein
VLPNFMEEVMRKILLVAVLLGSVAPMGSAFARDRRFDENEIWRETAQERAYHDAIRTPANDAVRRRLHRVYDSHHWRPHDPSGVIVLEGAK